MKSIKSYFLLILFLNLCTYSLFAQEIEAGPDTTVCLGQDVTLFAIVDGNFGTESYSFEEVPFDPEVIGGTPVFMEDDDVTEAIPIGFDFCFLGETYNEFYIGSNGWISFSPDQPTTYTSAPIPSTEFTVPKNCIMGPWEDWDPSVPDGITSGPYIFHELLGAAPNRRLVVSWDQVPMFLCNDIVGTFQIVIHEQASLIENHLWDKQSCLEWANGTGTQGVHDETGTLAFTAPGRNSTVWQAENQTIQFVPNGITWFQGSTIIGYGDTLDVSPLVTTTYTAKVTLCDGSEYSDDVTINVTDAFTVTTDITDVSCNGLSDGAVTVTASGDSPPFTYSWAGGDITPSISDLPADTYTVSITDDAGCTLTQVIDITEPAILDPFPVSVTNITCIDGNTGAIILSPDGGTAPYQYAIDGGVPGSANTFENLSEGSYEMYIVDVNGCDTLISVDVIEENVLVGQVVTSTDASCFGFEDGSIEVSAEGGVPPFSFSINGGAAQSTGLFEGLAAGTYSISVSDSEGCMLGLETTISEPSELSVDAGPNDSILIGASVDVSLETNFGDPTTILWEPDLGVDCPSCPDVVLSPTETTTYTITVSDAGGCLATDTITITTYFLPELYIPNAFSPNGDNVNDLFQAIGYSVSTYQMDIFNRWGELIYRTTSIDYEDGWDGTFNGETQGLSSYVYVIRASFPNGEVFERSGNLTLVR